MQWTPVILAPFALAAARLWRYRRAQRAAERRIIRAKADAAGLPGWGTNGPESAQRKPLALKVDRG